MTTRRTTSRCALWRLVLGMTLFVPLNAMQCSLAGSELAEPAKSFDDVQDLIFYSPKAPILIRLRIRIDGWGIHSLRQEHAQQLLTMLDADKDGRLAADEAAGIPPPSALAPAGEVTNVALSSLSTDADNNGVVTADELAAYLRSAAGAVLAVSTNVQQTRNAGVELFDRLDRDQDRVLSREELELAETRLRKMDVNDDERIQNDEIRPRIRVFGGRQIQSNSDRVAAALALLDELPPVGAEGRAARKLLQHYDKLARHPKTRRFLRDRQLSAEELGRSTEFIARHDVNGDGLLSMQELTELIRNPTPDFELHIDGSRNGESNFTVVTRPEDNPWSDEFDLQQEWPGRVQLLLAGVAFDCSSNFVQSRTNYEQTYRERFSNADRDQNDYLSPEEFSRLGAGAELFARVDADGNQMIFVEELTAYVRVQSLLERSRVGMTAANNSQSLFDHVDRSSDQMLDDAELAALAERISEWDRDGDGALTPSEFSESFRLVFSTGDRDPLRSGGTIAAAVVSEAGRRPRSVPNDDDKTRWFTRMDRNQDGRVSKREFLGPLETFAQLDSDQDGYLARDEAQTGSR